MIRINSVSIGTSLVLQDPIQGPCLFQDTFSEPHSFLFMGLLFLLSCAWLTATHHSGVILNDTLSDNFSLITSSKLHLPLNFL